MWARPPIVLLSYNTLRVGRGIVEALLLGSSQTYPLLALKIQPDAPGIVDFEPKADIAICPPLTDTHGVSGKIDQETRSGLSVVEGKMNRWCPCLPDGALN